MVFFIVLSMRGIVAYADDDDIKDYSWAKRAKSFMTYYNQGTVPGSDGEVGGIGLLHNFDSDGSVTPGNTGVFVAYDESAEDGISGWVTTKVSMASYSHGYEQYFAVPTSKAEAGSKASDYYHGVYVYARYGRTLAAMGFDTTSGDSNFSMGRALSGAPIIIAYMLSVAVPSIFHIVIEVLRALNPFSLFFSTITYDKTGDKGAFTFGSAASTGTFTNTNADNNGALSDVADALRGIYTAVQDLSLYALIPLFMAFAIAGFLLFRKNQNGEYAGRKIKMTVIRLAFIVMGMPLLGSVYTSVLENMSQKVSVGGSATSKMVLSTFVDFESWASNLRLAPPDNGNAYIGSIDATKDSPCGVVDENTLSHLREICARINVTSGSVSGLVAYSQISSAAESGDVDGFDSAKAGKITDSSSISSTDILNLLYRYYENEFYLAGAYEMKAKSDIEAQAGSKENYAIYAATNNPTAENDSKQDLHTGPDGDGKCYMNGSDVEVESKKILRDMSVFGSSGYNPFANGGLTIADDFSLNDSDSSDSFKVVPSMHFKDSGGAIGNFNQRAGGTAHIGYLPSDVPDRYREELLKQQLNAFTGITVKDVGGLSSMSLYNYLNTEFKTKELICYSTDSASNFVRKQHHSVNLIGTGITSFLYWFNLLCLCGGMAVVGFGYAFAIIVSNIRRSWQIIFNMPLAMMGALQAIAKMIVYTIVMIVEIIGTIFMYTIMEDFMYGISTIVEKPFSVELQNPSSAIILPTNSIFAGDDVVTSIGDGITCAGGFSSTVTISLMLLLSSFLLIWMTVNAFRFRKSFVKSVDEMCAKVVNKFVVGNDAGLPSAAGGSRHNSGAGLAPALAQGAAQGMMMHNLDKKDGDKNKDAEADKDAKNGSTSGGSSGSAGKDGAAGSDAEHDTENGVEAGESAETTATDANSDAESENSELDDNAAMDAESADDTGHTDSDDKAVAAAMDGSPTENKNVDVSADNDKVVNAASGDKSVEATNVDNSSMQDNTTVDDRDNNYTSDNAQEIEHAVEAGDAATVAGAEAAATVDSAMHGVDADGDADSNSGAGDSQSNANLADKEVADATGDHSVRADANPKANAGGGSTGNANGSSSVHGVGSGDSNKPFGKRAQRLQAKYDRQNNKAEQKAVKKDVSAAEKSARKEENRMIKANTAATQKANAAERKANKDLTAASMNAAKSKKAMAQNQLREARSAYRAAMDGNDKQKQAQAKENLIKARKDFTQANQSAKVASAEHRTASRMAKDSHIAMSNMATGAQGMIQRMDNSTKSVQMAVKGAGQTVANKSKAAANKVAPVVKTAGKVAGTTAKAAGVTAAVAVGTTALAAAAAAKTAENIYDTTVDDSF